MPPGTHSEFQANLYRNLGKPYLRRKRRKEREREKKEKRSEKKMKRRQERRGEEEIEGGRKGRKGKRRCCSLLAYKSFEGRSHITYYQNANI